MPVIYAGGEAAVENAQGCSRFNMAAGTGLVGEKLHKQAQ